MAVQFLSVSYWSSSRRDIRRGLGVCAAIVTIWPPDNVWSKAAWIVIFGGFLVLEITTLYRQRGEDQQTDRDKRREEDDRFATILKNNQHAFEATMRNMRIPGHVDNHSGLM